MSELRGKFISGVIYTGIAKYSNLVISIVVTAILARLISPREFGVVAIATVFINFFSTLTTVGISPAIIQNKTIDNDEIKSINSFTFLVALVITGIYLIAVPLMVSYYDSDQLLLQVMYLLSINIFFSIISIVPNALILKDKLFKFISVRTLVVQSVLGVISVIGALLGMGIYALLINPVLGSVVLYIINIAKRPVFWGRITKVAVDKILNFSIIQALFNLVYLIYRNADKFFIGKVCGMSELGFYEKSYRLMMLPLENVSSVISPVLHPLLSDYQSNKEMIWEVYKKMLKTLSEFCFFISVLLFFMASPIIQIMYGEKWLPAVPIFKILSLSVCVQVLQAPIGAVLQSINKVKGLLFGALWIMVFVFIGLGITYFIGSVEAVAISVVISFVLGFVSYQIYVLKYFNKRATELIRILTPDLIYSIILFAILFASTYFVKENQLILYSIIICSISFAYYLALLFTGKVNNIKDLCNSLIKKLRYDKTKNN